MNTAIPIRWTDAFAMASKQWATTAASGCGKQSRCLIFCIECVLLKKVFVREKCVYSRLQIFNLSMPEASSQMQPASWCTRAYLHYFFPFLDP